MTTKSRKKLEALVEALDDVPVDEKEARETVAALGIDVKSLAAKLRAKVAGADAADNAQRIQDARKAYAAEVEQLDRRKSEPKRSRDEQLVVFRALLARVPNPSAVAMHFHKYETATEEELAELTRALRHLLGEDESE